MRCVLCVVCSLCVCCVRCVVCASVVCVWVLRVVCVFCVVCVCCGRALVSFVSVPIFQPPCLPFLRRGQRGPKWPARAGRGARISAPISQKAQLKIGRLAGRICWKHMFAIVNMRGPVDVDFVWLPLVVVGHLESLPRPPNFDQTW